MRTVGARAKGEGSPSPRTTRGEGRGEGRQSTQHPACGRPSPYPSPHAEEAWGEGTRALRGELEELDGVEVLHAAADALGGVEQHVGLGAVGVAQHADADAVDDQIAAA